MQAMFAAARIAPFRVEVTNLQGPGRLLVTVLLGLIGVAAATSIASFASGTQGVEEMETLSETQLQPETRQADSRNGWLTVALDTALPGTLLQSAAHRGLRSRRDRVRRRCKTVFLLEISRATPMCRSDWWPGQGRPALCCIPATWRRLRPSPQFRMTFRWRSDAALAGQGQRPVDH